MIYGKKKADILRNPLKRGNTLTLVHNKHRLLVEASAQDILWGIGLGACDQPAPSLHTW